MAKKTPPLPKRFQPLQSQASTETAIRYGGQESGLRSIFDQTTRDYQRQAQSQDAASRSLLGALQSAPADLSRVYSDAGLSPSVLASISNSPTGTRLAGELARAQAGIQQQQIGAQAGAAYQQQHLGDQYREDVGKINSQAQALATERGLYESSLLDQLIGTDRKTRHDANVHTADQQFTADQNLLDNAQTGQNALTAQGLSSTVDANGNVIPGAPLPGAKSNKPKPKPRATPGEQATASSDFSLAAGNAEQMAKGGVSTADIVKSLTKGRKANPGKPVYENVPVKDKFGNVTGKKRQPKLNDDGTVVTTGDREAVDPVNPAIAMAAAEMATQGYVSPQTVKELHRLGYQVRGLPGIKTTFDRQRNPAPPPTGLGQGTGNPAGAPYNGLG